MVLTYEAYTRDGQKVTGSLNSENRETAAMELYRRGLIVSSIKTSRPTGVIKASTTDLIHFTRLLGNAVDAHLPLTRALELVIDELPSKSPLKTAAVSILNDIKSGESFSDALADFPGIFNRFYQSIIRAGEKSGKLAHSFQQILGYLTRRNELNQKIQSALLYPVFVLCFAIIILGFFVTVLIPKFQESYASFGNELPGLTRFLIQLTDFVKHEWFGILAVLFGTVAAIVAIYRTHRGRLFFESVLYSLPLIGPLMQKDATARLSRTLSVLLGAGVTLNEALELARGIAGSRTYEAIIEEAIVAIQAGQTFSSALKDKPFLPPTLAGMTAMGEESGRLGELLGHLGDFYEREVDASVEKVTSMLTPILIIGIGLMIGLIVIGLFLPIFDISKMIQ